jgi:hypothetical protein
MRGTLRRVRSATRGTPMSCRTPHGGREGRGRKRVEPQNWQRGATNPQPLRGESRRGGEKPRGRNMSDAGTVAPKEASASGSGRAEGRTAEGRSAGESQERRSSRPLRRLRGVPARMRAL